MLRRLTGKKPRKKSRKRQSSSSTGSFMNQVPIYMRNNVRKSLLKSFKTLERLNRRTRRRGKKKGTSIKTLKNHLEERGISSHYGRPPSSRPR